MNYFIKLPLILVASPFSKTRSGNKYIMVVVGHYSKWVKLIKVIMDHGALIIVRF